MAAKMTMPVPAMQQHTQAEWTTQRPSGLLVAETPSLNSAFGSLIALLVGIVFTAFKDAESAAGPQFSSSKTRLQQQMRIRNTIRPTTKPPYRSRSLSLRQSSGGDGGCGGGGYGGLCSTLPPGGGVEGRGGENGGKGGALGDGLLLMLDGPPMTHALRPPVLASESGGGGPGGGRSGSGGVEGGDGGFNGGGKDGGTGGGADGGGRDGGGGGVFDCTVSSCNPTNLKSESEKGGVAWSIAAQILYVPAVRLRDTATTDSPLFTVTFAATPPLLGDEKVVAAPSQQLLAVLSTVVAVGIAVM